MDKIITNKKILKTVSREITEEELIAYDVVNRMKAVLDKNGGVGLAAIQIGLPFRVAIIRWCDEDIIINPKVVALSNGFKKKMEECLSLPGITKTIKRHKTVTLDFGDYQKVYKAMWARILQHELDHFEGKLIDD